MPISVNEFRINLLDNINKFRSGSVPPNRVDSWLQQSSVSLLTEKYLAQVQNQKLDDDISTFHRSVNLPVETPEGLNYGLIRFPSDYTYFWQLRAFFQGTIDKLVSCGCPSSDNSACDAKTNLVQPAVPIELIPIVKEINIEKVDAGRWASVLNHRTKFPSLNKPYATEFDGGFKVAPRNLNFVTLDYYVLPKKAKFGYDIINNATTGVPYYQYNESLSTQIEWNSQVQNELLAGVMELAAGYLNNPQLLELAKYLKNTRA
jgi:hypothetical protein